MNSRFAFGQYYPTDSIIHRMDPRCKILLTIAYMVAIFLVKSYLGYVITAFVLPLLLLPSFFTNAISNAMFPIISREYAKKNKKYIKKKLWQTIYFSLIIAIISLIIINLYPTTLLMFFYKTTFGVNYLRFLSPIFILYSLEAPLSSFLEACGYAKLAMYDNLIGIIIKTVCLFILSFLRIGLYSLLIAMIINILIVTIRHILNIHKIITNEH